jgi:hypothetical protein
MLPDKRHETAHHRCGLHCRRRTPILDPSTDRFGLLSAPHASAEAFSANMKLDRRHDAELHRSLFERYHYNKQSRR